MEEFPLILYNVPYIYARDKKNEKSLFFSSLPLLLLFGTLFLFCPKTALVIAWNGMFLIEREPIFLYNGSSVHRNGGGDMADSNITKNALAVALKERMEQEPFSKISVGDICEACGMNRKSFYYHFRDKYDLVNWIFDTEWIAAASKCDYRSEWELLEAICWYLYKEQKFYRHALQITGQNSFTDYFRQKLRPILAEITKDALSHSSHAGFFLDMFCDAFLAALMRWLSSGTNLLSPDQLLDELHRIITSLLQKTAAEKEKNKMEEHSWIG